MKVTLVVGADNQLRIAVVNDSGNDARVYDSLDAESPGRLPGFLDVKVRDKSGRILTKVEGARRGYVSLNQMESTLLIPPLPLRTLQAHEAFERSLEMERLLGYIERSAPAVREVEVVDIKFRIKVCTDPFLRECQSHESAWASVDLGKIRLAIG